MSVPERSAQDFTEEITALKNTIAAKDALIAEDTAEIERLRSIIRNFQRATFGQKSEKTAYALGSLDQLSFLTEENAAKQASAEEAIIVPEHIRKKKGKRSNDEIFDLLPNEDKIYDVPEEQRFDADGNPLEYLGQERIRRELYKERPKLKVVNIWVKTYGSKRSSIGDSRKTVVKGIAPEPFYPHSFLTPALAADVLTNKYQYSLPLYRQSNMFKELGLEIPRNTLANWVIFTAKTYLQRMVEAMKQELLQQAVIHADETPLQVLKEPNKAANSKSHFWVYCTGKRSVVQVCCYEYRDSRSSSCAEDALKGYTGALVTDGYSGYLPLGKAITRAGCWAHMRRYWYSAFPADYRNKTGRRESLNDYSTQMYAKDPVSVTAFKYCNAIFLLEREFEGLSPEERKIQRQLKSKPIVEEYYKLVEGIPNPGNDLKKAVVYAINQRQYLCAFLENGEIDVSNNAAERSIRNCTLGRKNWLFSDTPAGAEASAIAYSIMATAKINNLNIYPYLKHILEVLSSTPDSKLNDVIPTLFPWRDEMQAAFRLE